MTLTKRPFLTLLAVGLAPLMPPVASATVFTMNTQAQTVTLLESGSPPFDATDVVTAGSGGPQIQGNTAPDPVGEILFQGESVNLHDLTIVYTIAGGGGPYTGSAPQCQGTPGCSYWDLAASDARFQFSNLNFGAPDAALQNVTLAASNVFGATVSDITANSFVLNFGDAGILNQSGGVADTGTLTMTLDVAQVPLPATLPLLLSAALGLGLLRRRRSCADASF